MNQTLFETPLVSPTAKKVEKVITTLQAQPGIHLVALSTVDGLAVLPTSPQATQLAAVAGFLFAAASQASLTLQLGSPANITFHGTRRFVCYPFEIGSFQLILTLVIETDANYRKHLAQAIKAIGKAMSL